MKSLVIGVPAQILKKLKIDVSLDETLLTPWRFLADQVDNMAKDSVPTGRCSILNNLEYNE